MSLGRFRNLPVWSFRIAELYCPPPEMDYVVCELSDILQVRTEELWLLLARLQRHLARETLDRGDEQQVQKRAARLEQRRRKHMESKRKAQSQSSTLRTRSTTRSSPTVEQCDRDSSDEANSGERRVTRQQTRSLLEQQKRDRMGRLVKIRDVLSSDEESSSRESGEEEEFSDADEEQEDDEEEDDDEEGEEEVITAHKRRSSRVLSQSPPHVRKRRKESKVSSPPPVRKGRRRRPP